MNKKERLELLIAHFCGGNKARFASAVGISPQALSHWFSRDTFDAEAIYNSFEGISGDWLLSGKGEMLRRDFHLVYESEEIKRLQQEVINLRKGLNSSRKIVVELDVSPDEFVKMGLKDKLIQVLNK